MGRIFVISLEGSFYSCKHCHTHLGLSKDILSKGYLDYISSWRHNRWILTPVCRWLIWSFQCRHGRAYLFDKVVNITVGEQEERMMMTGMHTVVDIFCVGCGSIVGWKYESAYEKSQQYKEGKFILERFKVLGPNGSRYRVHPEVQVVGSDAEDA